MQRRRFKQTQSLEERLFAESKRLRADARSLPPGAVRDRLLRKARQAETGLPHEQMANLAIASFEVRRDILGLILE
jgi:hypothetical protein